MTTTHDDIYITRQITDDQITYLVANNYRTIYIKTVVATEWWNDNSYDLFDRQGDLIKHTDTLDKAIAHASDLLLLPEYQGYHV